MSNMFYNYDHPHKCKHKLCDCCHIDKPEIMLGWSGTEIIYDEKGNEVGLGFNQGSPITLQFNFSGCVIDEFGEYHDIDDFINSNKMKFELLDFRHRPVYESIFQGYSEDQCMKVKLNFDIVSKLVPEIYYIKLTVLTEFNYFVLFTPRDGLIHIS